MLHCTCEEEFRKRPFILYRMIVFTEGLGGQMSTGVPTDSPADIHLPTLQAQHWGSEFLWSFSLSDI